MLHSKFFYHYLCDMQILVVHHNNSIISQKLNVILLLHAYDEIKFPTS